MYCVKCKTKTSSLKSVYVLSEKGRKMLKATCSVCGKNKSTFVKKSVIISDSGNRSEFRVTKAFLKFK